MITSPYNVPLMSQIMPNQSVPVQTGQNNLQPFQQPQTVTQQMQTAPSFAYPTNPQDPFKQPFYQLHQADVLVANHQYTPKYPYLPAFQTQPTISPIIQTQQPICNPLPQNVLDQIRNTISSAAPIFILPSGCYQVANQPASTTNQETTAQQAPFNRPNYCPPSFFPYPFPIPMFDPFKQVESKDRSRTCSCCHKKRNTLDSTNCTLNCCCNMHESEEHQCKPTNDDTICSKRNCPSSISLQALASQLLSLPGIISCAATRLILRKVAGSNITNTMEDIMEKAQRCIAALTKDQLLMESRNAQQVNALINLHMTTTPPANIIPLLTLLQLKVNVLKAQVESLINKKVMECQGYGFEVETSGPIDPTVLTMKTNAELRQLLSALRQKECDERVNTNFSPYHSQRVIAEARLNNVQAKIRQVEAEFERRRCMAVPTPTLTSRVVQQFSESRCMFNFAHTNIFEPYVQGSALGSPDPFVPSIRNPRKLYLKPREPGQENTGQNDGCNTTSEGTSMSKDTGTGEGNVNSLKDKGVESKSSEDTCSCEDTSSEESFEVDKKKLRLKIDETGKVTISCDDSLKDVSLLRLAPNVTTKIRKVYKKDRGRGKVGRKVTEEIKEDDEEVDSRDKLYAKEEDTDSEDYELFIFEEHPDDKDSDSKDMEDETRIEEDVKEEPESAESVIILDSTDTLVKKEPESAESVIILGSTDALIKQDPKRVETITILDSTEALIKKEPERIETITILDSTDALIKKEPESREKKKSISDPVGTSIKKEPKSKKKKSIPKLVVTPIKKEPESKKKKSIPKLVVTPIKKEPESKKKKSIPGAIDTPIKKEHESIEKIKTDVDVPIKKQPKEEDERGKPPLYTTTETIQVRPKVSELYVEPKTKTKMFKTEAHLYVEPEEKKKPETYVATTYVVPEVKTEAKTVEEPYVKTVPVEVLHVEPTVKTETETLHVVPKIKKQPKTPDIQSSGSQLTTPKQTKTATVHIVPQIKSKPKTKMQQVKTKILMPEIKEEPAEKTETETLYVVPKVKKQTETATVRLVPQMKAEPKALEPGTTAGPVTLVPQMKTEAKMLVPEVKEDPHVKPAAAEMPHVEPTEKTETATLYMVPKAKRHPKTLGIPLNVPQMTEQEQTETETAYLVPQAKPATFVPQAKPATFVPQAKPATFVPQAKPATFVPQAKAKPVRLVPQTRTEAKTLVPEVKGDPHIKKIPVEMLHVEPAMGTEEGLFFAAPKVKTEAKSQVTPSHVVSKVKREQELGNLEGNKVLETREPDESWSTSFVRTKRKFEGELKENVSKSQGTGSEAAAQLQTSEAGRSSDLHESTLHTIKMKPKKKKVIGTLGKENQPISSQENDESKEKNNKGRNVQFVSMMTRVQYNEPFGNFRELNIKRPSFEEVENSSKDIEELNSIEEKRVHFHSESTNFKIDNQQYESTEMNSEIDKNTLMEKMFPNNPRKNDKSFSNGLKRFPPLKHKEFKSATSGATFDQKKIESNTSKTICNGSTFHHRDSKTGNGIFSKIYSMIENQLFSFSSLFKNVSNFQDLVTNLNKSSHHISKMNNSSQQTNNITNNKKEINKKDDWILFPSTTNSYHSEEHAASGGHCVSAYKRCRNVHKIKQSIIVDKERENYILIGGSVSGQFRTLSRNGFKNPYKTRRSLIIRSQLRNSKNEYLRPFAVYRRLRKSKEYPSEEVKQTGSIEFRKTLPALPEIVEISETIDEDNLKDKKENDRHVDTSQETIIQRNNKYDKDLNNNYIDTSDDCSSNM